jgi:hypothetical protein
MTFQTSNTRLAAALKALGFEFIKCDGSDEQTAFRFSDNICYGKNAVQYCQLWREKQWHEYNQTHPFHYIVQIADARDWLINRVIHGEYQDVGGESPDNYYVLDINIAACIVAGGYYLLRFNSRRFYFVKDAQNVHKLYVAPELGSAVWWQCSYVKQLKELMGLVPRKLKLDKACASA